MQRVVMGIVDTHAQAEMTVYRLAAAGFPTAAISVLYPDRQGEHDFAFERTTKAPEGALTGAGLGAILGALLGIAAGVGVLVLPPLGALVASGPVLAALSGAAAGGVALGVLGAAIGSRIPEVQAKYYAGKVQRGSILVAVHADDRADVRRARDVMRSVMASDIASTTEAAIPNPVRGSA
jgi:hypothetical protein